MTRSQTFSIQMSESALVGGSASPAFQAGKNLFDAKSLQPFVPFARVVAIARPVQPKETRKAVYAQFPPQHVESVTFELFVGKLF